MNSELSTFDTPFRPFKKSITIPSSKSYANRLLILAALNPQEILVSNLPHSSDVETMLICFEKIGIVSERMGNDVIIKGQFPQCEPVGDDVITLETGDGGTTNRFLLPFLALGKRMYELNASGHMRMRPMDSLVRALRSCGVTVNYNPVQDQRHSWILVQGPYSSEVKKIEVDCSQTTQFLTGLALARSQDEIEIVPLNLTVSLPYWHLTQSLIELSKTDEKNYKNPVDFSSLSYPLALAAVMGEVLIKNCHEIDDNQADSQFIAILQEMGALIEWSEQGLHCRQGELRGISFDGSQCPDVIPTLIFVCCFAHGKSVISNLEVLTHKECNRFNEMIRLLKVAEIEYDADFDNYTLTIHGKGLPSSVSNFDFRPIDDHRMVMVTYLFQRVLGGGKIKKNAQHVKKSFANFFEVMG